MGLNLSHLISGGSAAGVALAGSFYLMQQRADELQQQMQRQAEMIARQVDIIEKAADQVRTDAVRIQLLEQRLRDGK